jgi:hypothetical protein
MAPQEARTSLSVSGESIMGCDYKYVDGREKLICVKVVSHYVSQVGWCSNVTDFRMEEGAPSGRFPVHCYST